MSRFDGRFAVVVATAATVVGAPVMLRHEPWRDEVSVWLVARTCKSLREELTSIGYIGHPKVYHALVWLFARLFSSPVPLACVNLAAIIGAVLLFAGLAPFSRLHRALFAFGFFPLYQYGVIVRPYALIVLLLFVYAALRSQAPARLGTRFVVLAALAQLHVMASVAAAVLFVVDAATNDPRRWSRQAWLGTATLALSGLASVWQLMPRTRQYRQWNLAPNMQKAFADGFMPIFAHRGLTSVEMSTGLILGAIGVVVALRHRGSRPWFVVLMASLVAFNYVVYVGFRWHHGFYFLYFVLALWLGQVRLALLESVYLAGLFALHAVVGASALYDDFRYPYSTGAAVAAEIRARGLEHLPIVGVLPEKRGVSFAFDEIQPVLVNLTDARAYDPQSRTYERYWRHYDDQNYFDVFPRTSLRAQLNRVHDEIGGPFVVVVILPKPNSPFGRLRPLDPLYVAPDSLDFGEHYALCVYPSPAS